MKTLNTIAISLLFCALPSAIFAQEAQPHNAQEQIPIEASIKAKPAVMANELKEIGLWGLGIEQADFKPIESDLWANSRAENLGILFEKINASTEFVPINQLVQRVLFSGGTAPVASNEIAKKRLMAAAKIGHSERNIQLLSMVPQISQSQYLTAAYADNLFAVSKTDEACALLNESQPTAPVRVILEMRAVCYALNGEGAAAMVLLDLATNGQSKTSNDQWLARAIIGLGQNAPIQSLKYRADNGYFMEMSNRLKLDSNAIVPQTIAPNTQIVLSRSANITQNQIQRIAAKSGNLSFGEYRLLQNDALGAATNGLDMAISANGEIDIKPFDGEEISKELSGANDIDDWWVIAQRIGPKLSEISNPNPKTIDHLIDAAMANSDIENARRFMAMSPQSQLYRNIVLAIIDNSLAAPIIRDGLSGPFTPNYSKAKIVSDLSILWAITDIDNGKEALLDTNGAGGTQLPQNIMNSLDDALARGAKAETILTASIALQSIDAKAADLSHIARIVRALKLSGFGSEAKELGIYSILARRINFGQTAQNPRQSPNISASQPQPPRPNPAPATLPSNPPKATTAAAASPTTNRPAVKQETRPTRPTSSIPDWRPNID